MATEKRKEYLKEYAKSPKRKKYIKEWWEKNGHKYYTPEKLANSKQYYFAIQQIVYDHYGNKCNCCGENNRMFLSIDHVNNDGNLEKDASGRRLSGNRLYNHIIKNDFPDTYQILCFNCNLGKARNKGTCPHNIE